MMSSQIAYCNTEMAKINKKEIKRKTSKHENQLWFLQWLNFLFHVYELVYYVNHYCYILMIYQ